MVRTTRICCNNSGQTNIERATIVKYHVEVKGCDGEAAFRKYVSDSEESKACFLHFIPQINEQEKKGEKILNCTLISWIDQDISDWLMTPPHTVSEYAAQSIGNTDSVKMKILTEEGWVVFDFDGSELINYRDCNDSEAEAFFEMLFGNGKIIRVAD